MTAPVPASSYKTSLGIAKEATKGTVVGATDFIPVTEHGFEPDITMLPDKSYRGSMVETYAMSAGVGLTKFKYAGNVFADTIGYPLAGVLGEVSTTGTTAPYSHTITLLNSGQGQPTAYTLTDNYAAGTRQIPGCQYEEVGFSWTADQLLTYTTSGQGYVSNTTASSTPSFSTIAPLAAWACTATIAGAGTTIILSSTLNIKRNVTPVYTAQNSQSPAALWGGAVMVDGTLEMIMEGDAELTRYLTNTQPALVLDFSTGAGAALMEVRFTITKCAYTKAGPDSSKADYVTIPVTFTSVGNTTDVGASGGYGVIACLLKNAKVASTYT